jgi:diaminohydroxyphosphoribosylaminopyrimidine deaminase/5-amino-6-(5-phosphoribosylamino)uracil reductase
LELEQLGVKIITCDRGSDFSINLAQMLEKLAQSGITRLLVEGGSRLATSFIKHNLVDELIWIKAPIILGNEGLPAIADLNISSLSDTKKWLRKYTRTLGEDLVEVYSAQHCHPERSET